MLEASRCARWQVEERMHKSIRYTILAAGVAALFAAGWGCSKPQQAEQVASGPLLSSFAVAQPAAERQLVDGFWLVENKAWRWTKHEFTVRLMPPPGAAQKGAVLVFRFSLPEVVISRRESVTLSASVGDLSLPAVTYTATGAQSYKSDVPAAAFAAGGPVKVTFTTDRYLRSGEVEFRELALIAQSFALVAK